MRLSPPLPAAVVAAAGDGPEPLVVVRAPGRVNLIGEHTDYNGLPVLPMAIDRAIWIAARARRDGRVRATNLDGSFAACDFPFGRAIPPSMAGNWENYLKAATQAVAAHLPAAHESRGGVSLTIASDLPAAAGLSSSSALVVATALATLGVHHVDVDRHALADELAAAERYVGVLSGGMDQAVILLAETGAALHIAFFPLRTRPVPIPPECSVIVADSLVRAEKSGGARASYNRRVVECRLACRVLAARLDAPLERLGSLVTLASARRLAPFVEPLAAVLEDRPLTFEEIAAASGVPLATLATLAADAAGRPLDVGNDPRWRPLARARHVLREADRVANASRALALADLRTFGRLMRASHESCRDDYEISVPALDELVDVAEDAGALGARMTGAGFGGAVVAVAQTADVPRILAALDERFYRAKGRDADPARHRFVFTPTAGATVTPAAAP